MASSSAAALTSLLNSLHSHLQSQIQHLPTLHAQLGLPQSALQDELTTLQGQLMHTVEVQMDGRRKEVDEWMKKCQGVEEDCLQYAKALGGNIKATGSTVGELRREQALPKRYELVTEYQEKLRQVYHTKLEQFTTLTNRLNALSRTLGTGFYQDDILELVPYNGQHADAGNASLHRDLTPERFSKLEKELVRGKAEVSKRLSQLAEIFSQTDWLREELGVLLPRVDDSGLAPPSALIRSSSEDPFLASTSTPTPSSRSSVRPSLLCSRDPFDNSSNYQQIFANFVTANENTAEPSTSGGVPRGLESVEPTAALISWANAELASLSDLKRRREAHIQALYDQLEVLWKRLGVADADIDAFVDVHRGSTEESVRAYEEELERMLEVKRERMGEFVSGARDEIWRLWDDLMVGEEERADFAPFADDEFTEELLTIHEDEIRRLKEERRLKTPLLASIKKYFQICEEEKELAAAASDQSRLLGRGAGGARDPGRLLREEKMRKRVKKEKPRLEQDLIASIPAWEQDIGQPFLVHGESIMRILIANASATDQENAGKRPRAGHSRSGSGSSATGAPTSLRAPTPGARAKTPVAQTNGKGVVTPAIRPSSSMSNHGNGPASKRQRVGDVNTPATRQPLSNSNSSTNGRVRNVSPTKIPGYGKPHLPSSSSLPRSHAAQKSAPPPLPHIAMPVPRAGTQHYVLGHGRVPSAAAASAATYGHAPTDRSVSASASYQRYVSGGGGNGYPVKVEKTKRESFRPRPSIDHADNLSVGVPGGAAKRWAASAGGFAGKAGCVKEESEDDDY